MTMTDTRHYEWQIIDDESVLVEVDYVTPSTVNVHHIIRQWSKENPPPHGHHLRYFTYGCRGEECGGLCTQAATDYRREQRIEQRKHVDLDDPSFPHGTPYGYSHLGCRRDCCREAMYEHQAKYPETPAQKARRSERAKKRRAAKKRLAVKQTKVAA